MRKYTKTGWVDSPKLQPHQGATICPPGGGIKQWKLHSCSMCLDLCHKQIELAAFLCLWQIPKCSQSKAASQPTAREQRRWNPWSVKSPRHLKAFHVSNTSHLSINTSLTQRGICTEQQLTSSWLFYPDNNTLFSPLSLSLSLMPYSAYEWLSLLNYECMTLTVFPPVLNVGAADVSTILWDIDFQCQVVFWVSQRVRKEQGESLYAVQYV